jgi:hypothetical protein
LLAGDRAIAYRQTALCLLGEVLLRAQREPDKCQSEEPRGR